MAPTEGQDGARSTGAKPQRPPTGDPRVLSAIQDFEKQLGDLLQAHESRRKAEVELERRLNALRDREQALTQQSEELDVQLSALAEQQRQLESERQRLGAQMVKVRHVRAARNDTEGARRAGWFW